MSFHLLSLFLLFSLSVSAAVFPTATTPPPHQHNANSTAACAVAISRPAGSLLCARRSAAAEPRAATPASSYPRTTRISNIQPLCLFVFMLYSDYMYYCLLDCVYIHIYDLICEFLVLKLTSFSWLKYLKICLIRG